jgi:ribosomal protein S18 acetylase RimI-like enzyme
MTVAFSEVHKLLEAKGIDYRTAFYAAEIGVSADYQGAGVGATLSAKRALEGPWSKNCEYVIARTKNSAVWAMYKKYFPSGQQYLFNDPVKTDSEWFVWRMSDFDHEKAQRVVDNGCIAQG